jgi:hypothetical protein
MNAAASSAYKKAINESQPLLRLKRSFKSFLKSLCKGSMARRNSIGERGRPIPLQWKIFLSGSPLRRKEEEAVHRYPVSHGE